jgi:DNA repair exonuclease SbcCD ATPase subunit
MRFITFKTLKGKNFLSFGDNLATIELQPGVNAITGTNYDKEDSKNGVGKSCITEFLYYALYGTTLRDIPKDYIQNTFTKKRCEVSLDFDISTNNTTDTYRIVRKLSPTKCQLFKNGEDITRSTLAKTNALIQDLIHTPATVFQNSVIMSVNTALPFMALPKTDKRKFIESVLGLEVFTQMVLKVRDDYSILKKDYELAYNKFEQTQTELTFNKSQLDNYEQTKQERIKKLYDKQQTLEKDIEIIFNKIVQIDEAQIENNNKNISKAEEKLKQAQEKHSKLQTKITQVDAEINSENKQIKQLLETKDKCPTCSRSYAEDHVKHVQDSITKKQNTIEQYNDAKNKVNQAIVLNSNDINKLENELKETKSLNNIIGEQKRSNETHSISLKHLQSNLNDVKDELVSANKEHNNELKGKIATLVDTVKESKDKVDKLNNELNIIESVKFIISEEGIKSFIVKKILKVLNSRLAYFLQKLEANCLCKFNEFFEEEIIDESNQLKSYFNFSGGERKRIDLACLFAFADIRRLQGDVNFSTVFYDELIDSSLDDKGVQLTLKVLRERYVENNESCYIITHRGPEVTAKAEHVIHVEKRNGVSKITQ